MTNQEERCGFDCVSIGFLALSNQYAVLITVRTPPSLEDIEEEIENLGVFRTFFPEYANRKLLGAVAGIVIEENASRYAYQQGLFVIGQSGETVQIMNDAKFRPKEW